MTPAAKFVFNHRLKLSWKFIKYAISLAFMVGEREGTQPDAKPKTNGNNVLMSYLDSTGGL